MHQTPGKLHQHHPQVVENKGFVRFGLQACIRRCISQKSLKTKHLAKVMQNMHQTMHQAASDPLKTQSPTARKQTAHPLKGHNDL